MANLEPPLVTLAVIAYNQSRFVREAVASAMAQDYVRLEIILSDDCSTDDTFNLMEHEARAYSGPHVIVLNRNASNIGLGGHINTVMKIAKGGLVVMAAGDDRSVSHRVTALTKRWIECGRPPALCSQAAIIAEDGTALAERFDGYDGRYPIAGESSRQCIERLLSSDHCLLLGCTEAWTPEVFRVFGPLHTDVVHEDNAVSLRAWLLGRIAFIEEPLVEYRTHQKNIAYQSKAAPRAWADFRDRELSISKRQLASVAHLRQHGTDLRTGSELGLLAAADLAKFERIVRGRLNTAAILGKWWGMNAVQRLLEFGRALRAGNWHLVGWMFPRLAGGSAFVVGRALLAKVSRGRRRIVHVWHG